MNIRFFQKKPSSNDSPYYYSGKYTLPAISVILLTILLTAILVTSYIYSHKLNNLTTKIEAVNQLDNNIHHVAALVQAQVTEQRNYNNNIQIILATAAQAESLRQELKRNGQFSHDESTQTQFKLIEDIWDEYLRHLKQANQKSSVLTTLNTYILESEQALRNNFQSLHEALLQHSRHTAATVRFLQMIGLLLVIIGVTSFLIKLLKQIKNERQLEAARLETYEILDTLSEGLFLLDKNMMIGIQQSKKLHELLPQIEQGGQNFLDLAAAILPDSKKLSTVKMFIEQLYNPRVVEKLIHGLNPLRKIEIPIKRGMREERRILGFHFSRVIQNKKIAKVLVSVRDLTDNVRIELRLQREQEQNDLQIEMISRMLNADESIMRSFLNTSLKQLAQINTILKNPGNNAEDLRNKARLISQEIHAFKGEASVLNMSAFVLAAESFEDIIQQMRHQKILTGNDFLPLVVELESLLEKVAQAEELHRKITGRLNNPAPLPVAASATDLGTLFGRFVVNMGYRHNKSVIMDTGGLEHLQQQSPTFHAIKDIIIQLLRNAVVHGIEPVRARTLNGKPSEGRISLRVHCIENKLRILIEDDGRGIDFDAVRGKAVADNLLTLDQAQQLNEKQLYAFIFRSGFSTLPENNQDAGRGIGMDIVRNRIKSLNGRISIETKAGEYTRFIVVLPIT